MAKKYVGIKEANRAVTPDSRRRTGWENDKGINAQYLNDVLFNLEVDQIAGTAAQVSTFDATIYWTGSQWLDQAGSPVTLNNGDRIAIVGWPAATGASFTADDLTFEMDPTVDIAVGGAWVLSGNNYRGSLNFTSLTAANNVQLTGSGHFLDIRADAPEFVDSSSANEILLNGNIREKDQFPYKNGFVNGDLRHWQRGTSHVANNIYLADMFVTLFGGTVGSTQRSATVPDSRFTYSLQTIATGGTTAMSHYQRVEADTSKIFEGVTTFSTYVYQSSGGDATVTGNLYTLNAKNTIASSATSRFTGTFTVPDSTWTRVYYTFDMTGMTDIGNGLQFGLETTISSGSFFSTGWQMERGPLATDYEFLEVGAAYRRSQRFYCKSYIENVYPPVGTLAGAEFVSGSLATGGGHNSGHTVNFPVGMIKTPAVTWYNTGGGGANAAPLYQYPPSWAGAYTGSGLVIDNIWDGGFNCHLLLTSGYNNYVFQWTADASI